VHDPPRHHEALVRLERDGPLALQVDQEPPLEDDEELVLGLVAVPVEVALEDPEARMS
jgi:hypothetical protein